MILLLFIHCLLSTHSHCVWGFCVESLFCSVALGVLSIVYQSTCRGRESWLLYFHCAVNCCLSVFCVSYSGCHGFVCSLWLWHFPCHTPFFITHSIPIAIIGLVVIPATRSCFQTDIGAVIYLLNDPHLWNAFLSSHLLSWSVDINHRWENFLLYQAEYLTFIASYMDI